MTGKEPTDYAAWLAENPAPDLQELVRKYGGYNKITAEAWRNGIEMWKRGASSMHCARSARRGESERYHKWDAGLRFHRS
jgi:hypothetical protein